MTGQMHRSSVVDCRARFTSEG